MSELKCFKIVSEVVEAATSQFAPLFELDEEKYRIFGQYCDAIDSIIEDVEAESLDVEIHEVKMTVRISIECRSLTIADKNKVFLQLAERTVLFALSVSPNGLLCVTLVFPSLWKRSFRGQNHDNYPFN